MFIKLTLRSGKRTWLNVFKMESITGESLYSNILFRDDDYPVEVKESPEQIVEIIREMKKWKLLF